MALLAGPRRVALEVRQDPPLHVRRRGPRLRRRRRTRHGPGRGRARHPLRLLRPALSRAVPPRRGRHGPLRRRRQLARAAARALATLLRARAIENQAYVAGRQPRRRGRASSATPATRSSCRPGARRWSREERKRPSSSPTSTPPRSATPARSSPPSRIAAPRPTEDRSLIRSHLARGQTSADTASGQSDGPVRADHDRPGRPAVWRAGSRRRDPSARPRSGTSTWP